MPVAIRGGIGKSADRVLSRFVGGRMILTLPITLGLLAASILLTVVFGWLGARPKQLGEVRMVNWQIPMMITAATTLMMLVHLLGLFGAQTGAGRPF
jgi:hypothetical protein